MPFPPQPIHSVPLLLAAEVGGLGGVLWLWVCLAPGIALIQHLGRTDRWAVATTGAWLALGVIGLWDGYPWALNSGRLLSVVVLGLVNGVLAERRETWLEDGARGGSPGRQ